MVLLNIEGPLTPRYGLLLNLEKVRSEQKRAFYVPRMAHSGLKRALSDLWRALSELERALSDLERVSRRTHLDIERVFSFYRGPSQT